MWRYSSSYQDQESGDLMDVEFSILHATWPEFDGNLYNHRNSDFNNVHVEVESRIGSAVAGLEVVDRIERHALWHSAKTQIDQAHRLIILGDDGLASDAESLIHLLQDTNADVVWAHGTPDDPLLADYHIWRAQDLVAAIHNGEIGDALLVSSSAGSAKRYLVCAGQHIMASNKRYAFERSMLLLPVKQCQWSKSSQQPKRTRTFALNIPDTATESVEQSCSHWAL
ncbi:unnamed protein product [Sympodiomycopsis kandeliae]